MATILQTRFARNGDVHIAYQTLGSGPLDLLLVDTWLTTLRPCGTSPTSPGSCVG